MNRLYLVDAFTEVPFKGNPAAVCITEGAVGESWMMRVAAEMRVSETAFAHPRPDGWALRWFTPVKEVSLCGHATLATAHVLREEGLAPAGTITFHTNSGPLRAKQKDNAIELDFPARIAVPAESNDALNAAMGAIPIRTSSYTATHGTIYLLEYESPSIVRGLAPDFQKLLLTDARAVCATSRSDEPAQDFVSRYFAPAIGVDEDPVTGSIHCCLALYWASKLGKPDLVGYQASHRGGFVRCRTAGDRVFIGGSAVTVSRGELAVRPES